MASKRVDEYSTATPADADQAIAIDASDTTDSSAGTVKRFVLSDLFTYILNKILARINTWTADQTVQGEISAYELAIARTFDTNVDVPGFVYGTDIQLTFDVPSGGGTIDYVNGLNAFIWIKDTDANGPTLGRGFNFGMEADRDMPQGLIGAEFDVIYHGATALTGPMIGFNPQMIVNGAGDVNNAYIISPTITRGGGRFKNIYGYYMPDLTGLGADAAYGLYLAGGNAHIGGDLDITATKTANTFWAGPATGSATAPTWRALVAADIPSLSSTYQPLDSDLTAIAALSTTAFGRALLALADASALRTAAALGTAATADTGTGAANVPTITQADARYQPLDSDLTAIAALSTTAFGRSLLAAADAAALRTLAALGTIATQDANNVSISGGAITGITDLAVADGGTGASTAANARTNLDTPSNAESIGYALIFG